MKKPKRLARLGRVRPSHSGAPLYKATSNRSTIRFKRLWSRGEKSVDVPISEILDFALNRVVETNGRRLVVSLCPAGITFREQGQIGEQVVSFRDLVELIHGQRLLPHAP